MKALKSVKTKKAKKTKDTAKKTAKKLVKAAANTLARVSTKAKSFAGGAKKPRAMKKSKAKRTEKRQEPNVISLTELQEQKKAQSELAQAQRETPSIPPHELPDNTIPLGRGQARKFRTGLQGVRHK